MNIRKVILFCISLIIFSIIAIVIAFFSNVAFFTVASRDLENALLQAQNANKTKSIFLNNMSHNIRTPMNAIIGFMKMSMDNNKKLL